MTIGQPYANHNGGMLAFGRDDYLYIGMGDGGSAGDPGNRAQNLNSLLGKMLRIDVNGTSGAPATGSRPAIPASARPGRDEIWSRGLRNPWRFSFDRVERRPSGSATSARAGTRRSTAAPQPAVRSRRQLRLARPRGHASATSTPGCSRDGQDAAGRSSTRHAFGACAVTGGLRLSRDRLAERSPARYVFGDFCNGRIYTVRAAPTPGSPKIAAHRHEPADISSFGEDEAGRALRRRPRRARSTASAST